MLSGVMLRSESTSLSSSVTYPRCMIIANSLPCSRVQQHQKVVEVMGSLLVKARFHGVTSFLPIRATRHPDFSTPSPYTISSSGVENSSSTHATTASSVTTRIDGAWNNCCIAARVLAFCNLPLCVAILEVAAALHVHFFDGLALSQLSRTVVIEMDSG